MDEPRLLGALVLRLERPLGTRLGRGQASGTTVASPLAARKMARYCGTSFTPGAKLNASPRISRLILFLRFTRTGSSVHAGGTASRNGRNSSSASRDIGMTWRPVLPCNEDGMRMSRLISDVTGSLRSAPRAISFEGKPPRLSQHTPRGGP